MRKEIDEKNLDLVAGGAVDIDASSRTVTFTTISKAWTLTDACTPSQARDYVNGLLDENPDLSERDFDIYAAKALRGKGWI